MWTNTEHWRTLACVEERERERERECVCVCVPVKADGMADMSLLL